MIKFCSVTFYFVGALGFMTMKGRQVDPGLKGNYGFLDQRAAMKFIHENIAVFGGNPSKVMYPLPCARCNNTRLRL